MEEFLYQLLLGTAVPVAWGGLGQGEGLPRIALYRVGATDDITLDGRSGWMRGRVQVDCYGETFAQAIGTSRAVQEILSGYSGGPIWRAALEGIRDLTDEKGGETIQRVSLDFALTWRD